MHSHSPRSDKAALRRRLQAARAARTDTTAADAAVTTALTEYLATVTRPGETVAIYLPLAEEPGSVPGMLSLGPTLGVRLLAPRVAAGQQLQWGVVRTAADLVEGAYGIPEPRVVGTVHPEECSVMLIPALALSTQGQRLGKGAGFYDRALAALSPVPLLVGVVYPEEVLPQVPVDEHDIPVQVIVTGGSTLTCHAGL